MPTSPPAGDDLDQVDPLMARDEAIWTEAEVAENRRSRLFAVVALEVLVASLIFVVFLARTGRDSGSGDDAAATRRTTTTTVDTRTKVDAASTPRRAAQGKPARTGGRPSTTTSTAPSTTTTTAPTDPVQTLPQADLTKPPQSPIGYFRGGKLYLEGSVPTLDVARRYYRKAVDILGKDNVFIGARLDPRAPAGPAKVVVQERFDFPTGLAVVDERYKPLLDLGVVALKKLPEAMLVITGYTDNVGPADQNQTLSEVRAQVVVNYMVSKGIPADRVIALGKGESNPIADNATPEGRAANRRIEGVLIGIMP